MFVANKCCFGVVGEVQALLMYMSAVLVFFSTIGRAAFTGNHQWIVHDPANDHNLRPEVRFVLPCELI